MKEKYFIAILLMLAITGPNLLGQNYCDYRYDYIWIMGGTDIDTTHDKYGGFEMNFNSNPLSLNIHPKNHRVEFQNTSMSSKTGDLIFYSNGCSVFNSLDIQMANGDSLNPGDIYSRQCPDKGYIGFQNMFAIPNSYVDSQYYLIHVDLRFDSQPNPIFLTLSENLYYTTIDMRGDNGLGVVLNKNNLILSDTTMFGTSVSAVKHANGLDWWVINPNRFSNSFNRTLIDSTGPHFINRQYIGLAPDSSASAGPSRFSPDGSKFAWYHPKNGLFLYDFDRHTGLLSNFQFIDIPFYSKGITGGLEFSPSGRFLYINHDTSLFQVDIFDVDVQSSLTHIADFDKFGDPLPTSFFQMQRTPDNRIFMNVLNGSQWLHIVQEPDKKGYECRFEQHTVKLPRVNNFTLPHFPNYRLGPLGEPLCDSIWVSTEYPQEPSKYKLGPIPTSGILHIYTSEDYVGHDFEVSIFNIQGNTILTSRERSIELFDLPPGVYICRISDSTGYAQVSKIVAAR